MQNYKHIINSILVLAGLMVALMPLSSIAQTSIRIDDYHGCANNEMLIPITVENFDDIAAFTIYIVADTANYDYVGVENAHESLIDGVVLGGVNAQAKLVLTWQSITAATIKDGKLCDIKILLKGGVVNFDLQQNSEIVQSDLTIVTGIVYHDGATTALNSYEISPASQSVLEESPSTIEILSLPENINCQWQISTDDDWINLEEGEPYQGVLTDKLIIESVSLEMNNRLYRCLLSNSICTDMSASSELYVTPNSIEENMNKTLPLSIYPNPVKDILSFKIKVENISNTEIVLINSQGSILKNEQLGNVRLGEEYNLDLSGLSSDLYVLQLLSDGKIISNTKVLKN